MARSKHPIPAAIPAVASKRALLQALAELEGDNARRVRALDLETKFVERIASANAALPSAQSGFDKFNTSPFVLLMYAKQKRYTRVSQIADAIVPAKVFSSMETSAGRMVEEISLPMFGWDPVPSGMQTAFSALDGVRVERDRLQVATLKSGPRCLNDEMSENFADAIISNAEEWAREHDRDKVEFTYGVLYGTQKKSNKKDWHIARNLCEKATTSSGNRVIQAADNRWSCAVQIGRVRVDFHIRIGSAWWAHLTGQSEGLLDVVVPLLRSCVPPGPHDPDDYAYEIADLADILDTRRSAVGFNSALIQRSQVPWLMLVLRHFYDDLTR